jgi:hypothetical protein
MNVVGGYVVTGRMLQMFRRADPPDRRRADGADPGRPLPAAPARRADGAE